MRIRDRLISLATASLTPGRSMPRGMPSSRDELVAADAMADTETAATAAEAATSSNGELPRQLGEQMLQSIHVSQQRLLQTHEALSVLASAIATADSAIRHHLAHARNEAAIPAHALVPGSSSHALPHAIPSHAASPGSSSHALPHAIPSHAASPGSSSHALPHAIPSHAASPGSSSHALPYTLPVHQASSGLAAPGTSARGTPSVTPPYSMPALSLSAPPPVNLAGGVMTLALHAANARALDGSYLFTGSGGEPPFSADGTYRGASASSVIILLSGPPPHLALAAAALTCLAPCPGAMDILPRLARAQLACDTNSPRALEACRAPLADAAAHLALLQARIAAAQAVLADATGLTSEVVPARAPFGEVEPEQPAAQLASTFGALEAARSLAERTLAIFPTA